MRGCVRRAHPHPLPQHRRDRLPAGSRLCLLHRHRRLESLTRPVADRSDTPALSLLLRFAYLPYGKIYQGERRFLVVLAARHRVTRNALDGYGDGGTGSLDQRTLRGILHSHPLSPHRVDWSRQFGDGRKDCGPQQVSGRHLIPALYHPFPPHLHADVMGSEPSGRSALHPRRRVGEYLRPRHRRGLCFLQALRRARTRLAENETLQGHKDALTQYVG